WAPVRWHTADAWRVCCIRTRFIWGWRRNFAPRNSRCPIAVLSYPGSGILGLVIDPQNYRHVFVLDTNSRVWGSFDEGASWIELTANLAALSSSDRVRPACGSGEARSVARWRAWRRISAA